MDETKHKHEYELKISGFETLSDDVNKQFELLEKELETNSAVQQQVVNTMLENIKTGYKGAYSTIDTLIKNTGATISDNATKAVTSISSINGAATLLKTTLTDINKIKPGTIVKKVDTTNVQTNLTSYKNNKGKPITIDKALAEATTLENLKNVSVVQEPQKPTKEPSNLGTSTGNATSISLDKTSATIKVGGTVTLTASCKPVNASVEYTWKSSNTAVATVSKGTVKGKKKGTATITVTDKKSGKTAKCKVTVKANTTSSGSKPASGSSNVTMPSNTASGIWDNIPKDTSMKGSSSLDKNNSIVDRMRYHGYVGSYATQKQLWSNLKGSGTYSGTAAQNSWMIEQLKKAGYSTGGIVTGNAVATVFNKAARANGDDGIGILSKGETVMPTRFTELMPQGLKILEAVSKIDVPAHNVSKQTPVINTNLVFNVDQISNDIDLEAFSRKIQKEVSQNICREVRKLH